MDSQAESPSPIDRWTMNHFSQANRSGLGQGHVPSLLRRVADSIEGLGDVVVEDISVTVYYHDASETGDSARPSSV
jgi:hypothetical protein